MERKFKVWDKVEKKWIDDTDIAINQQGLLFIRYEHQCNFAPMSLTKSANYEIMFFTGLLDKNKKEIYVGDILKWDDECTIVIKSKEGLGFYYDVITQKDKNCVSFDIRFYRSEESAEIIGNIKQNPGLLRRKKWQE